MGRQPSDHEDNKEARAMRAVQAMKRELPNLRSFVRAITKDSRKQVDLVSGGPPRTDGKTVFLPVPIELGDKLEHFRPTCGERDEDGVLLCDACRRTEKLYITLFHETAHMIHGTFAVPSVDRAVELVDRAYGDPARRKSVEKKLAAYNKALDRSGQDPHYMAYGQCVSEYLPLLVNALEDIRVNGEVTLARKGTAKMFGAHVASALRDGMADPSGQRHYWKDMPKNAQAAIGMYVLAGHFDHLLTYLDGEVAEAMRDDPLQRLAVEASHATSVEQVFGISVRVLKRLQELGFMLDPEEEEEPNEEEDEGDDKSGDSGESDESSNNQPEGDDKSDDDGESDGEGESGEPGESEADDGESDDSEGSGGNGKSDDDGESNGEGESGEPGEPEADDDESDPGDAEAVKKALSNFTGHKEDDFESNPESREQDGGDGKLEEGTTDDLNDSDSEALEAALHQATYFEKPSRTIGGVSVVKYDAGNPKGVWSNTDYAKNREVRLDQRVLTASLLQAKRTFTNNKSSKLERDLRRGNAVDGRKLGRRIPTNDDRIFSKRSSLGRRSYFVLIGLDVSGSTHYGNIMGPMKDMVATQAELLHKLGIPFAVYAHSGGPSSGSFGIDLEIGVIKAPNDPWSKEQRTALDKVYSYAYNLDGHTLEFYRKAIESRRESERLILYYTDGQMPAENFTEELEILQREIATCRRQGIHLMGVGCGTDAPSEHGLETVRFDSPADTKKVLEALRNKLV